VNFTRFFHKRFEHWLKRRIPASTHQTLTNRNVFIMPTKFGFIYLFFVLLLFILGTNYQNNIVLLLSYLLASLFITVMMHSFYNFAHLSFKSTAIQTGFANQDVIFPITIITEKERFDLTFSFSSSQKHINNRNNHIHITQCDIGVNKLELPCFCDKRGVYTLGRVKVSSEYSLGLFVTWTQLDFGHQAIVFPKAKGINTSYRQLSGVAEDNCSEQNGLFQDEDGDDFSELKTYLSGEPLSRIAWKQLAKGQGKYSKQYQTQENNVKWLKLSDMPMCDLETQLQFLSFLIIEYGQMNQKFGLLLGNIKILPSVGPNHQQKCLTALANY